MNDIGKKLKIIEQKNIYLNLVTNKCQQRVHQLYILQKIFIKK